MLLREEGYSPLSRVTQLQVMVHLSKWLHARELGIEDVTDERVEEYLKPRRADGYASFCSRASLRQLLAVLERCGAPLAGPAAGPASELDVLLAGYARFLRQERGLAASTTAAYALRARRFLDWCGGVVNIPSLTAATVTGAVQRESQTMSAGSAQFFAVSLRSFLRWCLLTGLIEVDLAGSSLPVTGRRRCTLPRGVSDADARALLRSCDRRTHEGRRDYAIILILLRLGLRAGEVAALRLDDIDWRAGQITVRGKGCRVDWLPLPADVGQAIAAYLRHARPHDIARREVFIRALAPRDGLTREAVGCLVRRASVRAGLTPFGPHRLRHTLACDMVRAGAPLREIGEVLRHADGASTSIYARVDVGQLRTVARLWPTSPQGAER
ncbi:MAG: tyrosine-type recombinase/integrase [Thermocrispum sp.]